ncbi:MAG: hypothetical protein JEZ06_22555 [Anaerolineaceae bacterium]|nr:hypothetical protein [Anaerolineaceae bacterium]
MTTDKVKTVIKRIIDDEDFRSQFLSDSTQALAEYSLAKEELDLFKNLDKEFLNAEDLEERISRWGTSLATGI